VKTFHIAVLSTNQKNGHRVQINQHSFFLDYGGPMDFSIQINDGKLKQLFGQIEKKAGNMTPACALAGAIVRNSVVDNFRAGGRWSGDPHSAYGGALPWKPLRPSTIAARRKQGKGAQILRDTAVLQNSITYSAQQDGVTIGTNVEYGPWQQFGTGPYTIKPKNKKALYFAGLKHPVRQVKHPGLPPRPFLVVQDSDIKEIQHQFVRFLIGGA
jgi:phage gpG-like protein